MVQARGALVQAFRTITWSGSPAMKEQEHDRGRQRGRPGQALNKVVDKGPRSRARLPIAGYYSNHLHSA